MENNPLLAWLQMHAPHLLGPETAAMMLRAPEKLAGFLDQLNIPAPTMQGLAQLERAQNMPAYAQDSYMGGGGGGANDPAPGYRTGERITTPIGPDITRIDTSVLEEWLQEWKTDPNGAHAFPRSQIENELRRRQNPEPMIGGFPRAATQPPRQVEAQQASPLQQMPTDELKQYSESGVIIQGSFHSADEVRRELSIRPGATVEELNAQLPPRQQPSVETPPAPEVPAAAPPDGSMPPEGPTGQEVFDYLYAPRPSEGASGTSSPALPPGVASAPPMPEDRRKTIGSILEALAGVTMPPAPDQPYAPPPGMPQVGAVPQSQLAQLLSAMVAGKMPLRFSQTQRGG